ncbi:hypothetical protein [Halorientalis marina]|jgi:hypothetical protein|uniref:hypothetical protein n=1 Tax=Halorientalis marina TaxID=2931976 RepID=UPI001FF2C0D1|nr:hypothetical protein [Halorientalis marina]
MVQAVVWMAALSVLLLFLAVPVTVRLMREILVRDEEETAVEAPARAGTSDSAPRQGHTGT